MNKILMTTVLIFSFSAIGKYQRAPSVDPDYPLVTEAYVPGVTIANTNIPKFPKLKTQEELLLNAFSQIEKINTSLSNGDSSKVKISNVNGSSMLTSSEGTLTPRNKRQILGEETSEKPRSNR